MNTSVNVARFTPAVMIAALLTSVSVEAQSPRPTPRLFGNVAAYLLPAPDVNEFGLRLDAAFAFRVDAKTLSGTVRDAQGRVTPAFVTPVPEYRPPSSSGNGSTWVGVRWETAGMAPGLYTLRVSLPLQVTDPVTRQPVPVARAQASTLVYLPPAPDKAPALVPGQRFLCLPDTDESLADYHDAHSHVVPPADLLLKVWTLARIAGAGTQTTEYFRVEGRPGEINIAGNGAVSALPGLRPLVEDDTVRTLRARYEGKRVWGYGGINAECVSAQAGQRAGFGADESKPVVIRRLVRIARADVSLRLGGQTGIEGEHDYSVFVTSDPLVALLELPNSLHVTEAGAAGKNSTSTALSVMHHPQQACLGAYALFADAWDFERAYSLVPWQKTHPEWLAAMRASVQTHELKKGMTPDMVAWVMGYPTDYGTAYKLIQDADAPRAAWHYKYPEGPFSYWVYFHKGRVVAFGEDGHLP